MESTHRRTARDIVGAWAHYLVAFALGLYLADDGATTEKIVFVTLSVVVTACARVSSGRRIPLPSGVREAAVDPGGRLVTVSPPPVRDADLVSERELLLSSRAS